MSTHESKNMADSLITIKLPNEIATTTPINSTTTI